MICPACTGTGMESTDPEDASTCLRCGGSGVDPDPVPFDVINKFDDEEAYEITDPKHPRHHERMADIADLD